MRDFLLGLVVGCMFHHLFAECRQSAVSHRLWVLIAGRMLTVWLWLAPVFGWALELARLGGLRLAMLDSCPPCFQELSGLRSQQIR